MNKLNTRAIVLAAGRSTRFRTKKTKLLFSICGQSMVLYPLRALEDLNIPISLVLGYQNELVTQEVTNAGVKDVTFVIQKEQLGTGHAVACTQHTWDQENVLILYGDMPLLNKELIQQLITEHTTHQSTITFFTAYVIDPTGYGRVLENDGKMQIIEEKDCTEEQRYINRVNAGIYIMKKSFLEEYIPKLGKSSVTGEIYLPELIKFACDANLPVRAISVPYDNVRGVNTLQELWSVEQIKRSELIKLWMNRGVRFELAQSIHLDLDIDIAPGSFIGTGVHLLKKTKIGEECFIGAYTIIENTTIGDHTVIHSHTVIQDSTIGSDVHVGPFARLRNNAIVGNETTVGNFVELKNTTVGTKSKMNHLSYLGDTQVGSNVNIGAGTITCNYDGVNKNTTTIEDNVFVGSNNTLVAPITLGKGSYTAAGSVITNDVPANALAIAREKQTNKEGYATRLREKAAAQKGNTTIEKQASNIGDDEEDENTLRFTGAVKTQNDHGLKF